MSKANLSLYIYGKSCHWQPLLTMYHTASMNILNPVSVKEIKEKFEKKFGVPK